MTDGSICSLFPCVSFTSRPWHPSCHPALWDFYNVRVFLDVEPEEQLRRIEARSSPEKLEAFKSGWIPLEEAYFHAFSLEAKCDFLIEFTAKEFCS